MTSPASHQASPTDHRLKKRSGVLTLLLFTVASLALAGSVAAKDPAAKDAAAPNPVQKEMRLLQAAMQTSVAAIAAGDVRHLPKVLHQVHIAAGDTEKALRDGSYRTPRNTEQIDRFLELDKAFHSDMIKMVKAARKNDVDTTARQMGKLMQRCYGCHQMYRDPPASKGGAVR